MLNGDIELIDNLIDEIDLISFEVAWNRIKKTLKEKYRSTNTESIQCAACSSKKVNVIFQCVDCGCDIEESNWRNRTQNTI